MHKIVKDCYNALVKISDADLDKFSYGIWSFKTYYTTCYVNETKNIAKNALSLLLNIEELSEEELARLKYLKQALDKIANVDIIDFPYGLFDNFSRCYASETKYRFNNV